MSLAVRNTLAREANRLDEVIVSLDDRINKLKDGLERLTNERSGVWQELVELITVLDRDYPGWDDEDGS